MKLQILSLLFLIIIGGCSKSGESQTEQKIWINGYELDISNGDTKPSSIKFIFFPENIGKEYKTKVEKSNAQNKYEYKKLPEDTIYTMLLDNNKIQLTDGTIVDEICHFTTQVDPNKNTKEIIMPVGCYFVVAIYNDRDYERKYWNKYTAKYYDITYRYNPITLNVVIPADLTQYGCIPWLNWADKPYEF